MNGRRVRWGPAPSDPRFPEADRLDLSDALRAGTNVSGVQVLFFGFGDGTWPTGTPGFLFSLEIGENGSGRAPRHIVSDADWDAHLAQAWPPGRPKRWYLRAFQEELDVRRFPTGWTEPTHDLDRGRWVSAMELGGAADKPAICTSYSDYLKDASSSEENCQLRQRQVPLMDASTGLSATLEETHQIQWSRPPEEYFEMRPTDAYESTGSLEIQEVEPGAYRFEPKQDCSQALTVRLDEQAVGWPQFEIDAPAGTIVEGMIQEAHQPDAGPALLNTHFHSWSRLTCGEEPTVYEPFDYETALPLDSST